MPKLSNAGDAYNDKPKFDINDRRLDDFRGQVITIKKDGSATFSDSRHNKDYNIDLASPDPGDIAAQVYRAMKITKQDKFISSICHRLRAAKFDVTERDVHNPITGKEVSYLSIARGGRDDESLTVGMLYGTTVTIWDNARPPQDRSGPSFDFAHPSWFDCLVHELRRRL